MFFGPPRRVERFDGEFFFREPTSHELFAPERRTRVENHRHHCSPRSDDTFPLAQVELADIVRLREPYYPAYGAGDRQRGPFSFGIVAEILSTFPDGRTRTVSLYLYDPERKEIFLGPNKIPEFVDYHCSEIELYKRASEQGYIPLV